MQITYVYAIFCNALTVDHDLDVCISSSFIGRPARSCLDCLSCTTIPTLCLNKPISIPTICRFGSLRFRRCLTDLNAVGFTAVNPKGPITRKEPPGVTVSNGPSQVASFIADKLSLAPLRAFMRLSKNLRILDFSERQGRGRGTN